MSSIAAAGGVNGDGDTLNGAVVELVTEAVLLKASQQGRAGRAADGVFGERVDVGRLGWADSEHS